MPRYNDFAPTTVVLEKDHVQAKTPVPAHPAAWHLEMDHNIYLLRSHKSYTICYVIYIYIYQYVYIYIYCICIYIHILSCLTHVAKIGT